MTYPFVYPGQQPPPVGNQRLVFISYSNSDGAVATEVCRQLEAAGIGCWMAPRDVLPGRDYGEEIIDAIESMPVTVLILSAAANASVFVKSEAERAAAMDKTVITLRVEDVEPSRALGRYVSRRLRLDAWPPPLSARVVVLANVVRSSLGLEQPRRLSRRMLAGLGVFAAGVLALSVALAAAVLPSSCSPPTVGPTQTVTAGATAPPPTRTPSSSPSTPLPGFRVTGSMTVGRGWHTATLLRDGRVLVVGGTDGSSLLASAEIYDPITGKFSPTGSMAKPRAYHTATVLPDGRVLVTGGVADVREPPTYVASAEIYDPKSGKFSPTGSMAASRAVHTATLLPDGRVLVAGGRVADDVLASAEIYDPASGKFGPTGSMEAPRFVHTATPLPGGRVLVVGGRALVVGGTNGGSLASAEIYDPASGKFSLTGSMKAARTGHTATLLTGGRVVVTGGTTGGDVITSAEIYDPASGEFTQAGSMSAPREWSTATLLPDGRVLVAGGEMADIALASAEVCDPSAGSWSPVGPMSTARYSFTATLLLDGRVLVAGGFDSAEKALHSAEIFQL